MRKIDKNYKKRVATINGLLIMILLISGCSTRSVPQPTSTLAIPTDAVETETMTSTSTSMVMNTSIPTMEPTGEPVTSKKTNYQFDVDLDYNKHNLLVRQSIQYTNNTGQDLSNILLVVAPNAKHNVFTLTSLVLSGDVKLVDYTLEGVTMNISFDKALPKNGNISTVIEYTLTPKLQGGILGYTAKQLNLSDWYPFVPPYNQETGWIIHEPGKVGEYLVYDSADFDLTLNLVDSKGIKVAGSTEVQPLDLDSFRMVQENSRNITFSVSDQYTLLKKVTNGVTVKGYVFEGDEVSGQAAVDYTANAIQLFSELFGVPYPRQTLSVVESDFQDGMEYDGLYYLSDFYFKNYDGTFQNYLALLSVHETSHHWWFGVVGNDQALEPWLDESLATYSEYLYIERYAPELANWWWQYRVAYYKPSGRVNLTIYDQSDVRSYINAVYLQGAIFLDQLRQELGDEAFFTGMQSYANTSNHKIANWEDFIQFLVPAPTEAVNTIIAEYFK